MERNFRRLAAVHLVVRSALAMPQWFGLVPSPAEFDDSTDVTHNTVDAANHCVDSNNPHEQRVQFGHQMYPGVEYSSR